MDRKIALSIFLFLAVMLSNAPAKPFRFKVLNEGYERGKTEATDQVIRDADTFRAVWDEIVSNGVFGVGL
ncbi:MAG TPA: hypothetical protein VFC63_23715 [Blastocatellia bacterium]|nr:hypothetical protein [Blastocatellia bacterium]